MDLSRGSLIKRGMWPLCVVEVDVTAEPSLQGSRAVVAPQVDVLVLQRSPQSLDPLGAGELRALIGIEDQRLTLIEGRIQPD
ncbi:hypothetical protein [Spiribacter onubensis]|uniref:Uncharacterized protein n=1 Tax=Spiribacter onubensis TaxID=3122420 RepID=A0ABV3S9I9_9GAMM